MRIYHAYTPGPDGMSKLIAAADSDARYLPAATEMTDELLGELDGADTLVLGGPDSKFPERQTRLIEWARAKGVPIIIVEDMPGSSMRPWYRRYIPETALVLTAMPQWKGRLKDFGYSRVEYVGPPPHWGVAYRAMVSGRNVRPQLRKKRGEGEELLPLEKGDMDIFFSGSKKPLVMNGIVRNLRQAGLSVVGKEHFILGFKPHPREPEDEAAVALSERKKLLSDIWLLDWSLVDVPSNELLPHLMKAVRLPVLSGGATDSIIAAYARLLVAYYSNSAVIEDLKEQGVYYKPGDEPDGIWFVPELGGVYKIDGDRECERALRFLLTPEGKAALRRSQEVNFTPPEDWDTAPKIVHFLEGQL